MMLDGVCYIPTAKKKLTRRDISFCDEGNPREVRTPVKVANRNVWRA